MYIRVKCISGLLSVTYGKANFIKPHIDHDGIPAQQLFAHNFELTKLKDNTEKLLYQSGNIPSKLF